MRKMMLIAMLVLASVLLMACGEDGIPTESTIVSKVIIDGDFYFNVQYEIDNYGGTYDATIKVTERIYNEHNVGDTYVFNRPNPKDFYGRD